MRGEPEFVTPDGLVLLLDVLTSDLLFSVKTLLFLVVADLVPIPFLVAGLLTPELEVFLLELELTNCPSVALLFLEEAFGAIPAVDREPLSPLKTFVPVDLLFP